MKLNTVYFISLTAILFLTSCGQPRRRSENDSRSRTRIGTDQEYWRERTENNEKFVIKMRSENGVYFVPCKINGTEMDFIFDTGASDITISLTEALFLYKQGKISDDDFLGTAEYQIADGSISEGTIINLKTVTIGNRTLKNIQASIVHNAEAPLLLGQSALAKFGKISIDYSKNEISFE